MIKMIALDLDGTLMSTDHMTVTPATRQALKDAHDNGAKIAIATGRTIAILGDVCEQVPEVDYIIHSNGAGVIDRATGKTIYKNFMSWDFCKDILEYIDEKPAFLEVYVDGESYMQEDKAKYFGTGVLPQEFLDTLMVQMTCVKSMHNTIENKEIEKFTIYINDRDIYNEVWNHLAENKGLSLASSLPVSMEFTNAGVDKGAALEGACKALGISPDECMAFGDAGNDIPMLKYAKYSFAMANATDECKAAASYETKSNGEDGVAYGINKIMFNK